MGMAHGGGCHRPMEGGRGTCHVRVAMCMTCTRGMGIVLVHGARTMNERHCGLRAVGYGLCINAPMLGVTDPPARAWRFAVSPGAYSRSG